MISIRRRLFLSLSGSFFLVWLTLLVSAFWVSQNFLISDFDRKLKNDSATILMMAKEIIDILPSTRYSGDEKVAHSIDYSTPLRGYRDGLLILSTTNSPEFPLPIEIGFKNVFIAHEVNEVREEWRLFYVYDADYDLWIILGSPLSIFHQSLYDFVLQLIWPLFLFLPLAALSIVVAVRSSINPLKNVISQIGRRKPHDLKAIVAKSVPKEIQPLIVALNELLARLDTALESERHFTDNAAHELRTPLAAVKTETQVARLQAQSDETKTALDRILLRVDYATRLVDQLLDLARIQASAVNGNFEQVDIQQIALNVLTDAAGHALDEGIDFDFQEDRALFVLGNKGLLHVLIRNLVENAVKYTPEDGCVSLWFEHHQQNLVLIISDTGPGISEQVRKHIFEHYYRGPTTRAAGSGLGMAIVSRIIKLHNAHIVLKTPVSGKGLQVEVSFDIASNA